MCAQNASPPASVAAQRARMQRQAEQNFGRYKELPGTYKMSDVCRLRVEKNKWTLTSKLRAWGTISEMIRESEARVKIDGVGGLNVISMAGGALDGSLQTFTLQNMSYADPEAIQVQTTVTLNFGSLSIGRYSQTVDGYFNITLSQGPVADVRGMPIEGQSTVQFVVQSGNNRRGNGSVDFQYFAEDFATLRREHAKEVDQYLRPMLRRMRLESVLASDEATAWQVFASEMKPEPAMMSRLKELLPILDEDSFARRDLALRSLRKNGAAMALAILHLDRTGLSDQQNSLLETALAPFQPQRAVDAEKLKSDADFLMDCLYLDDATIREAALSSLRRKLGRAIEFDVKADFDARCAAIDGLRGEKSHHGEH